MPARRMLHGARGTLPAALLACTAALFPAPSAQAGAWTQEKGKLQVITTALRYSTDTRFTNGGKRRPQRNYSKQELNPYFEYGFRDDLTLGGSLFLDKVDDGRRKRTSLGDSEVFLRKRVLRTQRYVLSVQPELKLPNPQATSSHTPAIGSKGVGYGVRLLGGASFEAFARPHYAELSAGYRRRTGAPEDQLLLDATLGLRVSDRVTVLPQLSQTLRVRAPAAAPFTLSTRDDYNLTKLQLSGVYQFDNGRAMQVGAFRHLMGNNTAAGSGVLVAYWTQF